MLSHFASNQRIRPASKGPPRVSTSFFTLHQRGHQLCGPRIKRFFVQRIVDVHQLPQVVRIAQAVRAVQRLVALQCVMHQRAFELGQDAQILNGQQAPLGVVL